MALTTSIHAQLTDQLVNVYYHQPLDPSQRPTWELRLLDIPTGESFTISYTTENDATLSFAAWLCADNPGVLQSYVEALKKAIPQHLHRLFLP